MEWQDILTQVQPGALRAVIGAPAVNVAATSGPARARL